jgi:hypothetical protein
MVVGASVESTPKRGIWMCVPVTAMVLLCEHYSRMYGRNVVDDAMTSMQYAKQLALGNGLVLNVGERVEGYTNFAWVICMAPIYWLSSQLGFDFVHAVVRCSVALAAANLVLTYALARRWLGAGHPAVWLAVGLCVVDNSFSVWAILGLEVHLLAFFMLLALWAALCAEHVLHLFESVQPDDPRPRQAIEQIRAWTRGEITMSSMTEPSGRTSV